MDPDFISWYFTRSVTGCWLFLVAGPLLAYTVLWLLCLVVVFPATFVVIYLAPATKEFLDHLPFWYPFTMWAVKYSNELLAIICGALSAWLALHIWPRWPATLHALVQRPSASPARSGTEA